MPINIGYTKSGRSWPGELEVSRLDAPAEQLAVDPSLPILGVDPKFRSDQVVIGRGRLVGLKNDADVSGTDIKTTTPHISYVTVADGVNIRPLGYAANVIVKDWAAHANGGRPKISRNYMIALPYIATLNGAYGALKQGDKVTAYFGSTTAAFGDPRYKGAVVKWMGKQVYAIRAAAIGATALTGDGTSALPQGFSGIAPRVIAAYTAAGADSACAAPSWDGAKWTAVVTGTAVTTTVLFEYGQGADMIAGDVWGMEGLNDMDGFARWVRDNFGAWSLPMLYKPEGNSGVVADQALTSISDGVLAVKASGGAVVPTRIDAYKSVNLKVKAGKTVYAYDQVTATWVSYGAGTFLPVADFRGAIHTQGKHYTVNPVTGVVNIFGLAKDNAGTPMSAAEQAAALALTCSLESTSPQPAYGQGLYGFTDGKAGHEGAPLQLAIDPLDPTQIAIGVMRVAIR